MEEVFSRFSDLGKTIFDQLDGKSLALCRKVCKPWKNFVDQEKTIWIRMIQKHIGEPSQDWQNSVSKASTDKIRQLAIAVCQFYEKMQIL